MEPVVVIASMGVAIAVAYWQASRQRKASAHVWQKVARRLGGEFSPGDDAWFNGEPMSIQATVEGVDVLVDHFMRQDGKNSRTFTRIKAPARGPLDLRITVEREGMLSGLGKAMGFDDLTLNDPEFDRAFDVSASDETLGVLWLNREVRTAMLGSRMYRVSLDKREVSSERLGLEDDPERLLCAIEAAARLAARGRVTRDAWRKLARHLGADDPEEQKLWGQQGSSTLHFERDGVDFEVEVCRELPRGADLAEQLVTRVKAGSLGPSEPFTINRRDEPTEPTDTPSLATAYWIQGRAAEAFARSCDEALQGELLSLNPLLIFHDGVSIGVIFEGVELRRKWISAAVAIVGRLAAPPSLGPYR